jgi:16S rRNA G527 N7-methylase RsmG
LQDLGFVVDKADEVLGSVSATKLDGYQLRITVTVRPRGQTQLLVRANAQYNLTAVEDPEIYQDFFTSLGKSMFLTAHNVD